MKRNGNSSRQPTLDLLSISTTLNTSFDTPKPCFFTHAFLCPRGRRRCYRGPRDSAELNKTQVLSAATPLASRPRTAVGRNSTTLRPRKPAIRTDRTNAFPLRLTKRMLHLNQLFTYNISPVSSLVPHVQGVATLSRLFVKGLNLIRPATSDCKYSRNRQPQVRTMEPRTSEDAENRIGPSRPRTAGCVGTRFYMRARTRPLLLRSSLNRTERLASAGRYSTRSRYERSVDFGQRVREVGRRSEAGVSVRLRKNIEIVLPKAVIRWSSIK